MTSSDTSNQLHDQADQPNVNMIEDISSEQEKIADQEVKFEINEEEDIHGEHLERPNFEHLEHDNTEPKQKENKEQEIISSSPVNEPDYAEAFTEATNQKRLELITRLYEDYYIKDKKFFYKDPRLASKVAFVDQDKKIATTSNDLKISHSLVDLAESKGWEKLKVTGNDRFKQQIWLEANARGIEVEGYKPTEQDLIKLSERKTEIERLNNQKNIIEHVVTKAIDKATDHPHNREVLKATLQDRLLTASSSDKLPTPLMYDKTAASQSKDQSVSKQIDVNKERTR